MARIRSISLTGDIFIFIDDFVIVLFYLVTVYCVLFDNCSFLIRPSAFMVYCNVSNVIPMVLGRDAKIK